MDHNDAVFGLLIAGGVMMFVGLIAHSEVKELKYKKIFKVVIFLGVLHVLPVFFLLWTRAILG